VVLAAQCGSWETVLALLAAGADVNSKSTEVRILCVCGVLGV